MKALILSSGTFSSSSFFLIHYDEIGLRRVPYPGRDHSRSGDRHRAGNEHRHRGCHANVRPEGGQRDIIQLFGQNGVGGIRVDVEFLRQLSPLLFVTENVPGGLQRALSDLARLFRRGILFRLRRGIL
jgi:hypothetical protein